MEETPAPVGVVADLLTLTADLTALAERFAQDTKALGQLGYETRDGWLTRPTRRTELREVAGRLAVLIARAEGADTGDDPAALADWVDLQRNLREVASHA